MSVYFMTEPDILRLIGTSDNALLISKDNLFGRRLVRDMFESINFSYIMNGIYGIIRVSEPNTSVDIKINSILDMLHMKSGEVMEVDIEDLYPVTVEIIGNDWKAINKANGEVSKQGRQSFKEALEDAKFLFQKWKHVNKCMV